MLAIQSGIANYHCLYTQGAEAFQTSGVFFDSPGIVYREELMIYRILLVDIEIYVKIYLKEI